MRDRSDSKNDEMPRGIPATARRELDEQYLLAGTDGPVHDLREDEEDNSTVND